MQQQQQQLPVDKAGDTEAAQEAAPQVVHLDVSTCAVLPELALEGESTSWQPDKGLWELDFGTSQPHTLHAWPISLVCVTPACTPLPHRSPV